MSRKRKKNKSAGGSNPSNDLYDHPSVVAARGRKDANTPGGAPKGSKPRRSRWDVDGITLPLVSLVLVSMTLFLSRVQAFWVTVFALIVGVLLGLLTARLENNPWELNLTLRYFANTAAFFMFIVATVDFVKAWS